MKYFAGFVKYSLGFSLLFAFAYSCAWLTTPYEKPVPPPSVLIIPEADLVHKIKKGETVERDGWFVSDARMIEIYTKLQELKKLKGEAEIENH